ncbi:MAG: dihydrofolate reductase family protein [Aliidongia sp.]
MRVCVVPIEDPDPRVAGRGFAKLREAGIEVSIGLLASEAERINAGFLKRIRTGRPLVLLKLASTLDGRIATHGGESRWITGESARQFGHLLRRRNDAVMVGSGTVLADDPELSVRLPGLTGTQPLRIVVDGRLRTPLTAKFVQQAPDHPSLILTLAGGETLRHRAFADCGVKVIEVPPDEDGNIDLGRGADRTRPARPDPRAGRGRRHTGRILAASNLVDRLAWFRSAGFDRRRTGSRR